MDVSITVYFDLQLDSVKVGPAEVIHLRYYSEVGSNNNDRPFSTFTIKMYNLSFTLSRIIIRL